MRKTLLCCLLALILSANPVFAVEGYKNLKFGMSLEEVKKSKICGWVDDGTLNMKQTHVIYCRDLKFNGESITAGAYFIDHKFLRLFLGLSYDDRDNILTGLKKKYGSLSYTPSQQSIDNFNNLPNQELSYGFDDNTVYLRYKSDNLYKKIMLLIYTSPLFDKLYNEKQVDSIKNDL